MTGRTKFNQDFNTLTEKIVKTRETQVFILTTHYLADFDDFSSLHSFLAYLNHLKEAYKLDIITHVCLSGKLDQDFLNLYSSWDYFWDDRTFETYTHHLQSIKNRDRYATQVYLTVFGCNELKRVITNPFSKQMHDSLAGDFKTICFDHHIRAQIWAEHSFIDDNQSSNAENMLKFFLDCPDYEIDSKIATSLLIGLMSDTVNFLADSTTPRTYQNAAELVELGASRAISRKILNKKWGVDNLSGLSKLMENTEYLDLSTLIWVDKKPNSTSIALVKSLDESQIVSEFSNEILDILKTEVVIMLKASHQPGEAQLSIRCLPDSPIKAIDLATHFGGGGHQLAAGAAIGKYNLGRLKERLLEFAKTKA